MATIERVKQMTSAELPVSVYSQTIHYIYYTYYILYTIHTIYYTDYILYILYSVYFRCHTVYLLLWRIFRAYHQVSAAHQLLPT